MDEHTAATGVSVAAEDRAAAENIPAERLPARRRLRGAHPSGGEPLRRRVLAERERISRTSRVREFVLGFQDGLLVPLAVVTGLAGADVASSTVVVGGLAEAAAGAVAMGTGAYLASQAENQLFRNEIADEEQELRDHPEIELLELQILLEEEGLCKEDAKAAADVISRSTLAHTKTKVEKELGLPYGEVETALGDATVTGTMYLLAAAIPLWPYFFWSVGTGLIVSLVATGMALFALGVVKGRVVGSTLLTSGVQVLVVGGASAAIGWLIGAFIPGLF
jgi:vacuolar iron transporter family protein